MQESPHTISQESYIYSGPIDQFHPRIVVASLDEIGPSKHIDTFIIPYEDDRLKEISLHALASVDLSIDTHLADLERSLFDTPYLSTEQQDALYLLAQVQQQAFASFTKRQFMHTELRTHPVGLFWHRGEVVTNYAFGDSTLLAKHNEERYLSTEPYLALGQGYLILFGGLQYHKKPEQHRPVLETVK